MNRNRRVLSMSSGFALVQMTLMTGALSVSALMMFQMNNLQTQSLKSMGTSLGFSQLTKNMGLALSNNALCRQALGGMGLTFPMKDSTGAASSTSAISLGTLTLGGVPLIQSGVNGNGINVTGINLMSTSSPPTQVTLGGGTTVYNQYSTQVYVTASNAAPKTTLQAGAAVSPTATSYNTTSTSGTTAATMGATSMGYQYPISIITDSNGNVVDCNNPSATAYTPPPPTTTASQPAASSPPPSSSPPSNNTLATTNVTTASTTLVTTSMSLNLSGATITGGGSVSGGTVNATGGTLTLSATSGMIPSTGGSLVH